MAVQPPRSWTKLFYAPDIIENSDQETVPIRAIASRVHMLWSVSSAQLGILPCFPLSGKVKVPVNQVVWNFAHLIYDMAGWGKVERVGSTETSYRV